MSSMSELHQYMWIVGGSIGAGAVLASTYYLQRQRKSTHIVHYTEQSILEPGPERIHASKLHKSPKGEILHYLDENIRTLYDVFQEGAKLSRTGNCLGWRGGPNGTYVWQSYDDTLQRAKRFGSGLISLGLPSGQGTNLGIYLRNCPEWIVAEIAAYSYSMVVVPLYDTLGTEAVSFILDQTEMAIVICEDDVKVNNLLDQSPKHLKTIITLKQVTSATNDRAKNCGVEIYSFNLVETLGEKNKQKIKLPKPDDLYTICYTSGTTGVPKGVMLTHASAVATLDSVFLHMGEEWISNYDVMFSVLPLAHVYERFCEHMMYRKGASVGFYSGDLLRLNEDMLALKPTIMVSVPRLLNKIHDRVVGAVSSSSSIRRLIFDFALSRKESEVKSGLIRNDSIWDTLVFKEVQQSMGGRLRMILTGSAPLSANVLTFVRCVLGCQVAEGYGQTEAMVISVTVPGDNVPGHVGPPIPCCKIKLEDVPDMKYYSANNQGEVCVKGANVFKGYYKDPQRTLEAIDEDGWLHTGDIGEWLPNGALKLIDRKKHIFKLSQGEYIAPEKIESVYLRSSFVEQVVVYGESLKSCLVAIVVPIKDVITSWGYDHGIQGTMTELCDDKRVKAVIFEDMLQCGKASGLKSFEQVKDIWLHPEPFTPSNGLLTPTMKTKRPEIKAYFKRQIENMYKNLD